ncbi:hypothetical protein D3C72_2156710 [compost metagenome]
MRQPQHQGHVRLRVQGQLFAAEIVLRFTAHWIDADHPHCALLHALFNLLPIAKGLVIGDQVFDLQVFDRIAAPQHDGLGIFNHQRQRGLLLIHLQ